MKRTEPMIHDNPKTPTRLWKKCKCNECGTIGICTPATDFYTETADKGEKGAPLYCWHCLLNRAGMKPQPEPGITDMENNSSC